MKRLLKEPLLHFLLLGAAFFLAYRLMPPTADRLQPREIIVTQGEVEHLVAGFSKTWLRPPTTEELAGLVRDRVREEIYCREAIALGLDKNDTVIRRRLRQKMEFVSDDIAALAEPSESDLNTYLVAHAPAFRVPPRFTFRQVYLNPEKHENRLGSDATHLLAELKAADSRCDASALGDPLMLEHEFVNVSTSEIERHFGRKFAASLSGLWPGDWHGPLESTYGIHLVLVSERTEGRQPALAEVRDSVAREWTSARRLEANERFYHELLKRYKVTIKAPTAAGAEKLARAE